MNSASEINGASSRAFGQMTRHRCFIVTARARSFLYHQVRLMVGVLKAVGTGDLTVNDVEAILNAKNSDCCKSHGPRLWSLPWKCQIQPPMRKATTQCPCQFSWVLHICIICSNSSVDTSIDCFLGQSLCQHLRKNGPGMYQKEFNIVAMQKACKILVGNHDFSSFGAAGCQAPSPIRTLDELHVSEVAPSPYFPSNAENGLGSSNSDRMLQRPDGRGRASR